MDLKSHPVFGYLLISLGLVAVGEGYWIFNRYSAAKKANAALVASNTEMAALKSADPFPNADNAKLIADDLKTDQGALEALKAQLKGNGAKADAFMAAKVPASADDFVIDLTAFREAELAKLAQLKPTDIHNKIKDTEAFGFSNFDKKGPPPALIAAVYREKQVAEYLMDTLLACTHKPDSFISLKREKTYTAAEKAAYQKAYVNFMATPVKSGSSAVPPKMPDNPLDAGGDVFTLTPLLSNLSARVPNLVDGTLFKLSFEAQTITMRELLAELGKFELPVVVRAVEWDQGAEGIPEEAPAPPAAPADAGAMGSPAAPKTATPLVVKAKPKVGQYFSKWTVTVEYIQLVTPVEADAAPAATSVKPSSSK